MKEKEIVKCIYSYLQQNWKATPILFEISQTDPATNEWLQVRILQIRKIPNPKLAARYTAEINFSIFCNQLSNAYLLDDYVDDLSTIIENKIIYCLPVIIKAGEFDITFLQKDDELRKTIIYRSIFCNLKIEVKE